MRWLCDPVSADVLSGTLDNVEPRTLSAEDFWNQLHPQLASFGISRIADITGLDRIGFPVVQAVRPLASSNAVTQGKALTLEGAAVGAVLECLEMAAGEHLGRFETTTKGDPAIWSQLAPGLPKGTTWPDAQTEFIACWDQTRDTAATLPRDLISTDFARDATATQAPILRHSIGLGAGTSLGAAMMHGLLECIEADARLRDEAKGGSRRLALSDTDAVYAPVLAAIKAAGLRVAVYDLPCKGGVIAVKASIMELPGPSALALPATGFAARLNESAAIAAALAEAAQARLAVISGAREDITQRFYVHGVTQEDLEAEWGRHGPAAGLMRETPSLSTTLREVVEKVGPVFAVPLHWDSELPLAITRVVAPDLISDPFRLRPS
jgi:ribosomal protein S12 methylthiotransferase accessory factor